MRVTDMGRIVYRNERCRLEFEYRLAKELVEVVEDLAEYSEREGLPPPVVTCVGRSPVENKEAGGVPTSLHLQEHPDDLVRAVDLRDRHYVTEELKLVLTRLQIKMDQMANSTPIHLRFEFIHKPHGTGPHIHLGLKHA